MSGAEVLRRQPFDPSPKTAAQIYATTNGVENQPGEAPLTVPARRSPAALVFTASGYNGAENFGGNGVNVLLAFSVDGK